MVTVSSCKKYPDGPLISLWSKEHRLKGTWDVESYTVDGIDSTNILLNHPYYGRFMLINGDKERGDLGYKGQLYSGGGTWYLKDNKESLQLSLGNEPPFYLKPYAAKNTTWEIRKLKEKELWLKTIYNGKEYFLKLKQ